MKGWKIVDEKVLSEREISAKENTANLSKVKITKALITLADVLRFQGEISVDNLVLGSSGVGIVSETDTNLFELEKGKRVYIDPYSECGKCYECVNGEFSKCSGLLTAGEDYDGFLSNFVSVATDKLFPLPDSISDVEALFINHVSLAVRIIDRLGIQKGDYVAIVGGNNLGNILAQLLIYYSAVPILMTMDDEEYATAKASGIYYVLGQNDNWQKEVSHLTSGRMAKQVVYISGLNIPAPKAFSLAAHNAGVAFTGVASRNAPISFTQAVKKQLNVYCINNGFGNNASSINLILNKAVNLSHLKLGECKYENVPETFDTLSKQFNDNGKITETVVSML